ncbi:hypothetical protein D3C86_1798360 [compost metagenome]
MSIAGRARGGMPGHVTQGVFKRIDESAGDSLARRREIVVQGLVDIARRLLARDDDLDLHAERRPLMRARRVSK